MSGGDDLYSRVDYRRLIAWRERIEREGPFLARVFRDATPRRLLDLGCGTGEHARHFASERYEVVGIDASESMLDRARDTPLPSNLQFVLGDLADLDRLVDGAFGGAICIGNTLPHLRDVSDVERFLGALRSRLSPGAPVVLQILNYEKIRTTGQRHLPVNVRLGPEGDCIVFLRLMDPRPDGTVVFAPSTLRFDPDAETPVEVVASRRVVLRGWVRADLEPMLEASGFRERELFGTVGPVPFVPMESSDLVIVARRER